MNHRALTRHIPCPKTDRAARGMPRRVFGSGLRGWNNPPDFAGESMNSLGSIRVGTVLLALSFASPREALPQAAGPKEKYPNYPSETPASFQPSTETWDYTRRIAEIPMRDGVRLHTVMLVPRGAKGAGILLTRTPYDAD